MESTSGFEKIKVWNDARQLNKSFFEILKNQNDRESGFLVQQLYRTAGSVMDNIAEGLERNGNRELIQFLSISKASAGELKSQLYRAKDFGILQEEEFKILFKDVSAISKQLAGFIQYLKNSERKGFKLEDAINEYKKDK